MGDERRQAAWLPQFVAILGIALGGIAAWEVVSNLTEPLPSLPGTGASSAFSVFVTPPSSAGFDPSSQQCQKPNALGSTWNVTVQVQRLDLARREMGVSLLVCPAAGPTILGLKQESVFLLPTDVRAVVNDTTAGFNAGPNLVEPAVSTAPYAADVTVPLSDRSEPYPSDAYAANLVLSLQLPLLDRVVQPSGSLLSDSQHLPIHVAVSAGPALDGYELAANQDTFRFTNAHTVNLLVNRSVQRRVFVYAMAMAPAILVLMLFHLFVLRRLDPPEMRDVLLGMTGVFLALLPLRGVLVPGEVSGVTRIDVILAAELATLVLVVAYAYGRSVGAIPDIVGILVRPVSRPRDRGERRP